MNGTKDTLQPTPDDKEPGTLEVARPNEEIATEQPQEQPRFPAERAAVARIKQEIAGKYTGETALTEAIENGLLQPGDVVMAEVSPSYRCPETCPGCPDSATLLMIAIEHGLMPKIEVRADVETMEKRIQILYDFGVRHFMFIGGTIDGLPETPLLISFTQQLGPDVVVSWFSDGIMQMKENGQPTNLLKKNLEQGWIQQAATHVSTDYPFLGNFLADELELPEKKGRLSTFEKDPEFSRRFKSQYGILFARRLVEEGVFRVVLNTTVSPKNLDQVLALYNQACRLADYACEIQSPTEVLWTFSPWIWRPHQARGDSTKQSPASGGLQQEHMSDANQIFTHILADTQRRIQSGQPRVLANSAGFTELMANSQHQIITVDQAVPYRNGRPEIIQVEPNGDLHLDCMFVGPELAHIQSTFGYRDREPRADVNPFSQFHDDHYGPWFPNIITTQKG